MTRRLAVLWRQADNLRWATQPDDVIALCAADLYFAVVPMVRVAIARHVANRVCRLLLDPLGGCLPDKLAN